MRALFLFILTIFYAVTLNAGGNIPEENESGGASAKSLRLDVKIPCSEVKDQNMSGTCWSFSTISFLESEIYRSAQIKVDLSEMYIVNRAYRSKADKFVRMNGKINFSAGGEPNDVIDVIRNYGIVTEDSYSGLRADNLKHYHYKMDAVLSRFIHSIVQKPQKTPANIWKNAFNSLLDSCLGELPKTLSFQDRIFTPLEFADFLLINPDDYVLITSFEHHPYYSSFCIEIPDNWSWEKAYNVELNELVEIADSALYNGYSLVWSADISEPGFMYDKGLAVAPEIEYFSMGNFPGDKDKDLRKEKSESIYANIKSPVQEVDVNPHIRQLAFDNFETTDDHAMHMVGKSKSVNGKSYYYIKNSWGDDSLFNGYLYVSESYFKYKTVTIFLNKNALPDHIRLKLDI